MFIERDGKKYELTAKELSDANTVNLSQTGCVKP